MSGRKRKRPRRGHHLHARPSISFIEEGSDFDKLNQEREARGFKLNENVRPYLSAKGTVTLRFVWRKRERGISLSITETIRF